VEQLLNSGRLNEVVKLSWQARLASRASLNSSLGNLEVPAVWSEATG
jgi:hypothetical protein